MAHAVDNMQELLRTVRRIEVRSKRLVEEFFSGEYHSSFKGSGIEFSNVREYAWGDDVRNIDWNTTARKNDLYVKVFREERERTLLLVVDGSGSMLFGSRRRTKRELAAEVCAVLAFSAMMNNDKVGLLIFTDRVETYIPPGKGSSHVHLILETMFTLQPQGRTTSVDAALSFIRRLHKRKAIVFLVTDLVDEGYEKGMQVLAVRHDFVLVHLADPLDTELPRGGLIELADAETGESLLLDCSSATSVERYRDYRYRQRSELEQKLRRMKIDTVFLETSRSIIGALNRFFRYRETKG
jgi:uncharacterized protein (DUF58 family)